MKRVFISYSRKNLDVVTQLIGDLQAVGIDTWHDQTLTGGQRWWDNILSNIRECAIFIFALSPESWDSEACRSELDYAMQLGKSILPVLVSDGININLLPSPLNEIQVTDYRRRDKEAAFAMVKSIHMGLPTAPLPDPLPTPPHVPVSYLGTLRERIDSPEPLSSQAQIALLFDLEEGLLKGHSQTEIRDLLLKLRRRDDLLAKISVKIDTELKGLEDTALVQSRENLVSPLLTSAHQNRGASDDRPTTGPRLCPECRTRVEAGATFCGHCGAALGRPGSAKISVPATALAPEEKVPKIEGSKSRRYVCTSGDASRLISDVKGWLDAQGFDSQQMNTDNQNLLLQIKKRGGWRDFVGMATSLNIVFHQSGDMLAVEIGAGKWIDKASVGIVSMLVLWPLALTAGFGVWEQMKMPEKIFDYIGTRLVYK